MTVALRTVSPGRATRLGPNEALRLSLLGAATRRPIPLETLIDVARDVGGGCWRPAADVLLSGIEDLVAGGQLILVETSGPGIPPLVAISPAGRACARDLMRLDLSTAGETMCRTLVMMKVAFLDLLEPAMRWRELDAMVDLLRGELQRRTERLAAHRGAGGFLCLALGQETREVEALIAWLAALRDAQFQRVNPKLAIGSGVSPP